MASWEGFKDWLIGGTSKQPSDFRQNYAHQGQLDSAIKQGLGTNRTAPQVGMDSPFRGAQLGQLGQLQGLASGQQRTAGEIAVQRQAQQAAAQQQAMARMARGGDAVLAQRRGAEQMAGIASNASGQAQRAAIEGQMQAHGLLTQAAGQARGQDQAIQLANLDAKLKQMGMDDQARLGYMAQLTGLDIAQLQQQMASYNQAAANPGMLGPLLSAAGTALAGPIGGAIAGKIGGNGSVQSAPTGTDPLNTAWRNQLYSDERLKEDVSDARNEIDAMLDGLVAKRYSYKDERHGKGSRVGIMAQDLRRSKAGADVTIDAPDGIALDTNKAVSALLASVARLNERTRELEHSSAKDIAARVVAAGPLKSEPPKKPEPKRARKRKWSVEQHRRDSLDKHRASFRVTAEESH